MLKAKQYLISHTSSGTLAGPGAKLRTLLEGILKICKSVCVVGTTRGALYLLATAAKTQKRGRACWLGEFDAKDLC